MKHVNDQLSDYLDGGLDGAPRREVETHLAACADCRAELEQLKSVVAWSKSAAKTPPPSGLEARLHARISRERTPAGRGRWWVAPGVLGTALAGYLAFLYVHAPQATDQMREFQAPLSEKLPELPVPAPAEGQARAALDQAQARQAEARDHEEKAVRREAASLKAKSAPAPIAPMEGMYSAPASAPMADMIGPDSGASGGGGVGSADLRAVGPPAFMPMKKAAAAPAMATPSMEWRGLRCSVSQRTFLVIRNAEEWRRIWQAAGLNPADLPDVDFDRYVAVAAFLGRDSEGRSIRLRPAKPAASGEMVVPYQIVPPAADAAAAETSSYDIKVLPAAAPDVKFDQESPAK